MGRKDVLRAANPVALCGEVSGSSSPLGRRLLTGFEAVPRGPALASLGGGVLGLVDSMGVGTAHGDCFRKRLMCRSAFFFLSKTDINCSTHAPNTPPCHLRARHLRYPVEPRRGAGRQDLRWSEAGRPILIQARQKVSHLFSGNPLQSGEKCDIMGTIKYILSRVA